MRIVRASVIALIAVLASGCATHASGARAKPPSFAGPWAGEFADHYKEAESDFVREVLKDGKITDQEHREMTDRFRKCLASAGVTFTDFNPDGSMETTFAPSLGPDRANEAEVRCSREAGENLISSLYFWIKSNPDNLDEPTIMASCLVRKGVVPPVYSPEDFRRDSDTGSYPYVDKQSGDEAYTACASDPLGLIFGTQADR
ncbi:hypothetical protein [Diaminobutyricibacter sp. McL0608]|uniref:hypothetical protein n=1 Tax=Leifsonia sp. McL0608 TaxID=3143537 RepID=UPI0031F2E99F